MPDYLNNDVKPENDKKEILRILNMHKALELVEGGDRSAMETRLKERRSTTYRTFNSKEFGPIEIKMTLTDHFANKGIPYDHKILSEEFNEEVEEKEIKPKVKKSRNARLFSCLDVVRRLVSQKKRRLMVDGWDLDLTYITNRMIACGFPASGVDTLYRNKRSEIRDFLKNQHGTKVKIYNLCAEDKYVYNSKDMEFPVRRIPFKDHHVTGLERILDFCLDASLFLQRMEQAHRREEEEKAENQESVK